MRFAATIVCLVAIASSSRSRADSVHCHFQGKATGKGIVSVVVPGTISGIGILPKDGQISVVVQSDNEAAAVEVKGELAFAGAVATSDLPFYIKANARSVNRQVTIGKRPIQLRVAHGEPRSMSGQVYGQRNYTPLLLAVKWACDAIELTPPPRDRKPMPIDNVRLYPKLAVDDTFTLRENTHDERGVHVDIHAPLHVAVLATDGKLSRIRIPLDDFGAFAEGWVPNELVGDHCDIIEQIQDMTFGSELGIGEIPVAECSDRSDFVYRGKAMIKSGARVYSAPDATFKPWATATPTKAWTVSIDSHADWVAVDEVPGLLSSRIRGCGQTIVWVKRSDVTLAEKR